MLGKVKNLKIIDFNETNIGKEAVVVLVNWAFNFNNNLHLVNAANTVKKIENRIECAEVKLEEKDGITLFEFKLNPCRIIIDLDYFE